jgi:chromosome segregation ATPase
MNIKDLIDEYVKVKAHREQLTDDVRKANNKLGELEKDIMDLMSKAGITQAASDKASLSMKLKQHPAINDWKAFYGYVAETGQFELLHKRLSSTAFRERWDAGEAIPGTSISEVWELSVYRK